VNLPLVVLVTVLNHLAYTGSRVTVSLFALHEGASPLAVGVLMSLFALLSMLISVPVGRLVDRIGVFPPLAAAACGVFAGLLLPFAWPDLRALFPAAVAIGTGFGVYFVVLNNMTGALGGPEDRARNFSWLALGFSTGGFIGPMLAGFAIDSVGHRATFLALAASPALALVPLFMRRRALPQGHGGRGAITPGGLLELLAEPRLRAAFLVSGALAMGWDLFSFALPVYGTAIGLSASTIGVVMGSFAGATFSVRLLMPALARRLREWTVIRGAMFTAGGAFALFPLARDAATLIPLSFLLGLGLGAAQPMIMALLYAASPPGRQGEVVGVRTAMLSTSSTTLPLVFGALGAALGMAPVFLAMSACLVAGGWITLAGRRRA
jgi:predicted MFS family arabinose efflux permease